MIKTFVFALFCASLLNTVAVADTDPVSGKELVKAGPGLYYFYGRGVLRVPGGWRLIKTHGNRLEFENASRGIYPENCLVSPAPISNGVEDQAGADRMAAYLIQDDIDDFKNKSAKDADVSSRRWTAAYRGMMAARFFGSARIHNLFARRNGSEVDGYVSTSVIEIARAHVTISVRCNGFYPTIREGTGSDMLSAIDVDPSRPYVLNP